ncbi:hypothetical protein KEM56_001921 [Ascosphaera pollenicola]|nr:hypothetical protein KEM56_001921 [Ascosphaera pollenicola]
MGELELENFYVPEPVLLPAVPATILALDPNRAEESQVRLALSPQNSDTSMPDPSGSSPERLARDADVEMGNLEPSSNMVGPRVIRQTRYSRSRVTPMRQARYRACLEKTLSFQKELAEERMEYECYINTLEELRAVLKERLETLERTICPPELRQSDISFAETKPVKPSKPLQRLSTSAIFSEETKPLKLAKPIQCFSTSAILLEETRPKMSDNCERINQASAVTDPSTSDIGKGKTPVPISAERTGLGVKPEPGEELFTRAIAPLLNGLEQRLDEKITPIHGRLRKLKSRAPTVRPQGKGLDPALDENKDLVPSVENKRYGDPMPGSSYRAAPSMSPAMPAMAVSADEHVEQLERKLADLQRQSASSGLTSRALTAAPNTGEVDRERHRKWDVREVGIFYPNTPRTWGEGDRLYHKDMRYYRDVSSFAFDVRSYMHRNPMSPIAEHLEKLVEGTAYDWYVRTPTVEARLNYTNGRYGVEQWLSDLGKKFRIGVVAARKKLGTLAYGPAEIRKGVTVLLPDGNTSIESFVKELKRRNIVWQEEVEASPVLATDDDAARRPSNRYPAKKAMVASSLEENAREAPNKDAAAYAATPGQLDPATQQALDCMIQRFAEFLTRGQDNRKGNGNSGNNSYRQADRPNRTDDRRGGNSKEDYYQRRNRQLDSQLQDQSQKGNANLAEQDL